MLSGDMFAVNTTCPDRENNRSHGTVVAGEARYLNASLTTRPCDGRHSTLPPPFQWTSSFVDLWFSSIMS